MTVILDWWATLQPWSHWVLILIQGAMFGVILWALRGSRLNLKAVVDELGERLNQRIDAVQEAVDQPPAPVPVGADPESWERIRELWRDARMRIEAAIDGITDGRVLRKYSSLSRYSYEDIIKGLRQDGLISADAAGALATMNEKFLADVPPFLFGFLRRNKGMGYLTRPTPAICCGSRFASTARSDIGLLPI